MFGPDFDLPMPQQPFNFDQNAFNAHLCSDGLCIENRAFDMFKRFWARQKGEAVPHSTWHTALHESAHAVTAISRGLAIKHATIIASETAAGHVAFERPTRDILTDGEAWLDAALAGFILDQSRRVANDGAREDLASSFRTALDLCMDRYPERALRGGGFPSFVCVHKNPLEELVDELVEEHIKKTTSDMYSLIDEIVAVATVLYEQKTLSREQVESIMSKPAEVFAVHPEREDEATEIVSGIGDVLLALRENSR